LLSNRLQINIQACVGAKSIASEQISPYRKDVVAKCKTGGDVTRKNKLLEKQQRGKRRMKQMGKVTVPQEAFMAIVQRNVAAA
jgi:translation elongation factor EF-4